MDNDIRIITLNFCKEMVERPLHVEFYIPKDNILTFNEKKDHYPEDNELMFMNYSGGIGVPSNIAINIPDAYNEMLISGVIASPADIRGKGTLNLIIKPESDLEVLIQADGTLIFDGEHITSNRPGYELYNYGYGQRLFTDIQNEYIRRAISQMNPPKIIDTPKTYNGDFKYSKINTIRDIDICIKENLVNIMKFTNCITNVSRYNVDYRTVDFQEKKPNATGSLKERLNKAIKDEDYELAAEIRDEINKRELKKYDDSINNNSK